MINYDGKIFRPITGTENGETSPETVFRYRQVGNVLSCEYAGGKIRSGHLIGLVDGQGNIEMRYHQINDQGQLMTGECRSSPQLLENGKIRLYENWQWTCGDRSNGHSVLEEQ